MRSRPNTSTAVMQRRVAPADGLDFYPTPPWATRALCEILQESFDVKDQSAWEPACGQGDMARPLQEYFGSVYASDIHDHGGPIDLWGGCVDFLMPNHRQADWIITNPPFRLADQFALTALERARKGVALLVRTAFLEGAKRHSALFDPHPPSAILQFVSRPIMAEGRLRDPAVRYFDQATQTVKTPSTATAYAWILWLKGGAGGPHFIWLDTPRAELERPGDYPPLPEAERPPRSEEPFL